MKEMFNAVLDKDEEIIKVYKPNKKRFVLLNILRLCLVFIPLFIFFLVVSILAFTGNITVVDDAGVDSTTAMAITTLVLALLLLLIIGLFVVAQYVRYTKTFYAFSNKRILIRSGFIGVDFLTLEMKLIGAIAINVGLLDKFIKPNTGSIRFGSNSTPMGVNQNRVSEPSFTHIDDAYVTYREIKEVVDAHVR